MSFSAIFQFYLGGQVGNIGVNNTGKTIDLSQVIKKLRDEQIYKANVIDDLIRKKKKNA